MRMGRLVLLVRDFAKSMDFYHHQVGLPLAEEPEANWATFDTGECLLSIAGPFPGMVYDPKSLGDTPDQLNFLVEDLTEVSSRLRANGVELGEPHSPGEGVALVEFRDPDGRYLALEERRG